MLITLALVWIVIVSVSFLTVYKLYGAHHES
jgi:hypothetical protein